MDTEEHQLFETALAATMNKLDLAFSLKEEQKTALESFLCKKDVFAVVSFLALWIRHPVYCSDWS